MLGLRPAPGDELMISLWRKPAALLVALLLTLDAAFNACAKIITDPARQLPTVAPACPDGRVFKDPGSGVYDTALTFGSVGSGQQKWFFGVLARSGIIYGIPSSASAVLRIDPTTDTITSTT